MTIAEGTVYNGMPASDLGEQGWERPWSGPNGGSAWRPNSSPTAAWRSGSPRIRPVPR